MNFHLGFIKIAMEITMEKFISENDNINCVYSRDKREALLGVVLVHMVQNSKWCHSVGNNPKTRMILLPYEILAPQVGPNT